MIKLYFTTAIRNIYKHKTLSLISVLGLAIGFAAFILISVFLKYEYSYDKHNENYGRIYRVIQKVQLSGKEETWNQTPAILPAMLRNKIPEFEQVVLMREAWGEFLSVDKNIVFFEPEGFYAEQPVFNIFTFNFIEGDKNSALEEPFTIVLSETMAGKLFPNETALGKNVLLGKKYNLKVTGVYEDWPENSHERPAYLISFLTIETTLGRKNVLNSLNTEYRTYILLKDNMNVKQADIKIANLFDDIYRDAKRILKLEPLKDIYLSKGGDGSDYIYALEMYALIGIFLIILASINYINLQTANASLRGKEIGIKKISGSRRYQVIFQFLSESLIIAIIALNFAFLIAKAAFPFFSEVVKKDLSFSVLFSRQYIAFIIGLTILTGILSGIYPAFVVSSYKSVNIIKNNLFQGTKGRIGLKRVLVGFQYVIAIFLIIQSIQLSKQINFMLTKDLGFDKEDVIYTQFISSNNKNNFEELRQRLLQHPEFIDAAVSWNIPFHGSSGWAMNWEGNDPNEKMNIRCNYISHNYLNTFGMGLISGRNFSPEYPSDIDGKCIINETAWKFFGWDNPIGKRINDNRFEVIGVVKDFHPYSMHEKIPPFVMPLHDGNLEGERLMSFKIKPGQEKAAKEILNAEFNYFFPDDPFEFKFLENQFGNDDAFTIWKSINQVFIMFSFLILLLAIIGMFGLVSFTTKRRTKEMGIRKVLGSPVQDIYYLLIKEFLILLLIGSMIAFPAAYYTFKTMPGAYHYDMQVWEFLSGTLIVLLISVIATSYQTIKVSLTNPSNALKYE